MTPHTAYLQRAGAIGADDATATAWDGYGFARMQAHLAQRLVEEERAAKAAAERIAMEPDRGTAYSDEIPVCDLADLATPHDGPTLWKEEFFPEDDAGELPRRWRDFDRLARTQSGRIIKPEQAEKQLRMMRAQWALDEKLADALAEGGRAFGCAVKTRYTPEERPVTTIHPWGDLSNPIVLPNLRRVNFFPGQSSMRRAPLVRAVEFLLQSDALRFARMMTLTNGARDDLPITRLRAAKKEFHIRVRELTEQPWFRAVAEMQLVSFEYGSFRFSLKAGDWTAHLHAHCLYLPHDYIPPEQWAAFHTRVEDFMGAHCKDNGMVQNAHEFGKYCLKPQDAEVICSHPELVFRLFVQTHKLPHQTTYGKLRAMIRAIDDAGDRTQREETPDGKVVTRGGNWNAGKRPRADNREKIQTRRKMKEAKRSMALAARKAAKEKESQRRQLKWKITRLTRDVGYFRRHSIAAPHPQARANYKARMVEKEEELRLAVVALEWFDRASPIIGAGASPRLNTATDETAPEDNKTAEVSQSETPQTPDTATETAPVSQNKTPGLADKPGQSARKPVKNRIIAHLPPSGWGTEFTRCASVTVGWDGQDLRNRRDMQSLMASTEVQLATAAQLVEERRPLTRAAACDATRAFMEVHNIHVTSDAPKIPRPGRTYGPPQVADWPAIDPYAHLAPVVT